MSSSKLIENIFSGESWEKALVAKKSKENMIILLPVFMPLTVITILFVYHKLV